MTCPICGSKVLYQGMHNIECASNLAVCPNGSAAGGKAWPAIGDVYSSILYPQIEATVHVVDTDNDIISMYTSVLEVFFVDLQTLQRDWRKI